MKLETSVIRTLTSRIIRGASTSIEGNPSGEYRVSTSSSSASVYNMVTRIIDDSPATTSATTYKLQIKIDTAASTTAYVSEGGSAFMFLIEYEP